MRSESVRTRAAEPPADDWSLAERLLRLPSERAPGERPEEFLGNVADALEEALTATVEIHWADVDLQPPEPRHPHWARLTVKQQDAPFALLDVLPGRPLPPVLTRALDHLATDLTHAVNELTNVRMRRAVRDLRVAMASGTDIAAVASDAVAGTVHHMSADGGLLLLSTVHGFRPLVTHGDWPDEPAATRQLREIARLGLEALGPMRHADAYVTAPVACNRPARLVLLLRFPAHRRPHSVAFPLLAELASVAAPYVDARWRDLVFTELLELNRVSEKTSTATMYSRVLKTALSLVPGADSGTLLTRATPDEPFRFQAAQGFDLELLRGLPLSEEAARAWYGDGEAGWQQGVPRILSSHEDDIGLLGDSTTPHIDGRATAYDCIESTLCLPVLRDGQVMAILNLDNLHDARGLGRDSSQLAHLFGAPLASLLHRQATRELLERAALTDDLTGLYNRRAFAEALEKELARARRGGAGPSLMLLDLKGFKAINDSHGHDAGDEALVAVADTLRASLRSIDVAARRGGDEFVALLVDTPPAAAATVGERIKRAVAAIDLPQGPLQINIGAASYQADGADAERLMRLADERMYEEKRGAGPAAELRARRA